MAEGVPEHQESFVAYVPLPEEKEVEQRVGRTFAAFPQRMFSTPALQDCIALCEAAAACDVTGPCCICVPAAPRCHRCGSRVSGSLHPAGNPALLACLPGRPRSLAHTSLRFARITCPGDTASTGPPLALHWASTGLLSADAVR